MIEKRDREAVCSFYGGDRIPLPHRTRARLWAEEGGTDEAFHTEWNRLAECFAAHREKWGGAETGAESGSGAPAAPGSGGARRLILAAKYAKDHLLFWRPKACGYTIGLNQAGRFTEAEAKSKVTGERGAHVALPESALEGYHVARVIDGDFCTKLARIYKEGA
jgi:hypothetical protein